MSLKLKDLKIVNFKSFLGEHTFALSRMAGGAYFVGGKNNVDPLGANGAGKSAIWEAMTWCGWGKTHQNVGASDIEPWSLKKPKVCVEWSWEYLGREYVLRRTRNPITLQLSKDGGPFEEISQDVVPEVLGLTMPEFTNTVLLGQGAPLFFDLKPAEKMAMFQEILNLGPWIVRSKAADNEAQRLDGEIRTLESTIAELRGKVEEKATYTEELSDRSANFMLERQKRADQMKEQNHALVATLRETEKVLGDLTREYDGLQVELEKGQATQRKYDKTKQELTNTITALDIEIEGIKKEITREKAAARSIQQLSGATCPTCTQPVSKKHTDSCLDVIDGRLDKLEKMLEKKWEKFNAELERQREVRDESAGITKELEALQKSIRIVSDEKFDCSKKVERQQTQLEEGRRAVKEELEKPNEWKELLGKTTDELKRLQEEQTQADVSCRKLEAQFERVRYWIKGFKQIRLLKIDESLSLLEVHVNSALQSLGLYDWRIEFAVEREKKDGDITREFTVLVYPSGKADPVNWQSYSGGELQRLRIAALIGIKELIASFKGVAPSVEIYDEPTSGLSAEGIQDLITVLQARAEKQGITVYIVDHRALDLTGFAGSILVTKDNHGSSISTL